MKGPPKVLKVSDVPKYLMHKYQLEVTRQTVYNWMNKGLRNDTLQFTLVKESVADLLPSVRVTTEEWVDEFLHRSGIQFDVVRGGKAWGGQADGDPGQQS